MAEKIVFFEMKKDWQQDYVAKKLAGLDGLSFDEKCIHDAAESSLKDAALVSVFINSRADKKLLEKLPKARLIATRSTGYDHIDVVAAKARGIAVATVPTYGENTVAEHTFALILSLSRNLRRAYFKTRDNDFSLDGLMGFDLKGKTLGVVGTGHIGLHVIHMARGFGMTVIAHDVKEQTFLSEVMDFRYVSLEELLSTSDIVSLHVPYMPQTHHLINSGNISKIKRGAILINTSRGGLVETAALVKALDEGIFAGAGLDVLEGEELILEERRLLATAEDKEAWGKIQVALKNHVLLTRDNVIYTPHMAFYSEEAVRRILDTTIQNIRNFLQGRPANIIS